MNKAVKLLGGTEEDRAIAKILINKNKSLKRDLISIARYCYTRRTHEIDRKFTEFNTLYAHLYSLNIISEDDIESDLLIYGTVDRTRFKSRGMFYERAKNALKNIE